MIVEMGQWALDAVGKLGPLAVAIAVLSANRRQTRWANTVAARSASVEDQKMRLALLDRRLTVIAHLRGAQEKLTPTVRGADAMVAVLDALREAEFVYEDEERDAIRACFQTIAPYQTRYAGAFAELRGQELAEAMERFTECTSQISSVMRQLGAATRIRAVAPLAPPI